MTAADRPAKPVTRREVRAARRHRARAEASAGTDATGLALARLLPQVLALLPDGGGPVATVAVYVSLPGEPGTGPLRAALRGAGHRVLLPVLRDDLDLDWAMDETGHIDGTGPTGEADPLRPAGRRLGPGAVTGADLVLVPALAVDTTGTRLGQGGGSFDRALARLPVDAARPLVLAVVHEQEVLEGAVLPREAHDVAVAGVLTPTGVRLLAAAAADPPPARPPRA